MSKQCVLCHIGIKLKNSGQAVNDVWGIYIVDATLIFEVADVLFAINEEEEHFRMVKSTGTGIRD